MAGKDLLPLIEGGKGISVTSGASSGPWAAAGGIGTVSAVNADSYDEDGSVIRQVYNGRTRRERHEELVRYSIEGGVEQVRRAHENAGGGGAININILWEMGGAQRILEGVLDKTRELVSGVTCGAGMPYKLAEICAGYGVHYYPIVSSGRAFRALWKRAYHKFSSYLGAVVYEDPWLAGGHNGLSNSEDPQKPEDPYPRVVALRQTMRDAGCPEVPIIMAGGVWFLREWEDWLDNPEVGPIAFQFGTRPLVTRESPIPEAWKQMLLSLKKGDVLLHHFSPTGFYSSAIKNRFLQELVERSDRQIAYSPQPVGTHDTLLTDGSRRKFYVTAADAARAAQWLDQGYGEAMKTPDNTLVFVTTQSRDKIRKDQADCMGCLSQCQFSNWADNEKNSTGRKTDPRSFCIQKTLQDVAHGASIEDNLVFAGHNAYRFSEDPFYSNGFIPNVKQLVDRILTGD
ncbi:2-nitropropane dioxygenase [Iodidimonas nitroreducens]|uniref:2-nitropropane dioxygenase n=2 Tax=Iodidimonas nitroreducens TaxID=1236968 RepID=A0A5A7N616_9PROT|nr:2-nitropropane dioxygenase [Iodidimonas nitroreducens]